MPATTQINAIIVTHESAGVLPGCLDSVRGAGLAAIVVDNASTDDTAEIARASGARVIVNAKNEGFGRAHNIGVAAADAPYCLLLNPDIQFAPEAPALLLTAMDAAPNAALAAPMLIEPDGRRFELATSPINPARVDGKPSVLSGAALLARRDVFLELGGFDPNIFLFWEDNDLCRRIIDRGRDLLLVRQAEMLHARGGSSAPRPGVVYRARWHQAWSRLYVFQKYHVEAEYEAWTKRFARKLLLARLTGARRLIERYQGSLDGALAFRRGESALAHEGLA